MLSKSAAKTFFITGTAVTALVFGVLTVDTLRRVPKQTNQDRLSESAIRGKHLWDTSNCMGCHTIMGEGAYYAPELTKVYERRGPAFIKAMLKDPGAMYPGERKMQNYGFNDAQMEDLVAFLKWIGEMDLNGFPKAPTLANVAVPQASHVTQGLAQHGMEVAKVGTRPHVFNQMCVACHALEGQGGSIGPKLDGVGTRLTRDILEARLKNPQGVQADSKMPKLPLSDQDVTELVAYLSQLKETK